MSVALSHAPLDENAVNTAAQYLYALRKSGQTGERLASKLRPQTAADGWRIQQRVSRLREQSGEPIIGWKCGLPPASEDRWVVAALHERVRSGEQAWVPTNDNGFARIEPEFAFVLACDLLPRPEPYAPAEVDAAISAVHLAVEVLGCRYANPTAASGAELMADGLWNQSVVIGPAISGNEPATFSIETRSDDEPVATVEARHADANPRVALYWLVEFMRQRDIALVAGQAVISGSLAGVIELPLKAGGNDVTRLRYDGLGEITVSLTPFATIKRV